MSVLTVLHRRASLEGPGIFVPALATYVLTINGEVKKLQPGWNISETAKGRNTFTCDVLSVDASYRPPIGAEVILTENGARIFGGTIDQPSESGIGSRGFTAITTSISASDFNAYADGRVVNTTIGGSLRTVLQTLVTYLFPYGVTLDPAQLTAPAPPIPQTVLTWRKLRDVLDEVAIMAGNYIWEIDYNKVFRMLPPGTAQAPFSIINTNPAIEGDITVEPTRSDYANSIVLIAGQGQRDVTDTFTGNGQTAGFSLNYQLVQSRGVVSRSGIFETLSVLPDSGGTWVYDPATNAIFRVSPPGVNETIQITYVAQFPKIVQATANPPVSPLVEQVVEATEVYDVNVAQALAKGYLARAMATPRTVKYTTRLNNLHPGQLQQITVAKRNVAGAFTITDVRIANTASNLVRRTVTAVEGTILPENWRDTFRQWTATSGGGTSATQAGGVVAVVSSGGVGGAGNPPKLAKWAAAGVLGDSVVTDTGAGILVKGTVGADLFNGSGAALFDVPAPMLIGDLAPQTLVNRSLADLGIRDASALSSGTLAWARLPSGGDVWIAAPTISGLLTLLAGLAVTGAIAADDIRITTNNTAYKGRNAAGTADLPLMGADGSNKTTVYCNSARLRFANPTTVAAPTGSPVGGLSVTIDGVGDVTIPYY